MKIAYNPLGSGAHTPAPDNKDIIFDLVTRTIYAKGVPFDGTKYIAFKKHTSPDNTGGSEGLVPIPSYSTTNTRLLREDGLWVNVAGVSDPDDYLSTESTNSVENRVIAEEFEKVFALLILKAENVYKIINVGGINLVASGANDVLEFVQGDGILLLPSEINKSITISTRAIGLLGIDISYNSGQLIAKVADTYFNRWNEVFNWYTSVTEEDTDNYINKWQEIVDFLNGVPDTTLNGILANFVKDLETTGEGNAVTDVSKVGNKITVTKGNSFLPLTGGTVNGWVNIRNTKSTEGTLQICTGSSSSKPRIRFEGDISWGYLGFASANKPCYYDNSLNEYILWHSGNDGTGSGLDADLLDGQHASYFATTASLGNYVTLNTAQTISGVKTFSTLQKFTVAQGTSPFTVTSKTTVVNLSAALLDGTAKSDLLTDFANVNTEANPNSVSVTVGGTTKYLKVAYSELANKVVCSASTSDQDRPILVTNLSNGVCYTTKVKLNYSTGNITAPTFTGALKGNADTATTASKLSTVSKKAWGLTYWTSGGIPTDISGDMTGVGNITINATGNTDYFINFLYNSTPAYSWRLGYLGSGSGNANYFVIDSSKSSGGTWHRVLLLGNEDLNATFSGQVLAPNFVSGDGINDFSAGTVKLDVLNIPTSNGGTTFGPGSNGQVLKSNGTTVYWASDNNSNSWRAVQVNGTQIAGTGTGTYALNFISGTGITVAGTSGSSSAANSITITNAGVRSVAIGTGSNSSKVAVNTNGTTAYLTIPYATTAKSLSNYYSSRPTTIDPGVTGDGSMFQFKCTSSVTDTTTDPGDGHILHFNWDNNGKWDSQIYLNCGGTALKTRGMNGSGWNSWVTYLNTSNYTSYLGYIGTTSVQSSSAALALTGITNATMSGTTTTKNLVISGANQYRESGGIILSNSDIWGLNAIYTSDLADAATEGYLFKRTNGNYDSLWCKDGIFYFSPNGNNTDGYSTNYTVLHSGNSSVADGGSTWGSKLTVKINGTTKTLTIPANPNTWRPITNDYDVTTPSDTTSLSQTGAKSLLRNVRSFKRFTGTAANGGYDLNVLTDGMIYNYGSSGYWKNGPSGMSYGRVLNLKDGSGGSIAGLLAWDTNHNSTTDTTRNLWWRVSDDGTFTEAKWHRIAYADNIPTKTSLLTNDSGFLTSRGYIGTTAVLASSAVQTLTGISRISNSTSAALYLGNSGNQSWVMTQDICSHSGSGSWAINIAGTAWFKNVNIGYTYNATSGYNLGVTGTGYISSTLTMGGVINTCSTAGSWVSGMTNASIKFNSLTAINNSSYYPILGVKANAGHVVNFGAYVNSVGFYGYYNGRTANSIDWSFVANTANGNWTATASIYAAHFYENSDIQLKTNILEILNSDKMPIIKEFDWKEDGSHSYGLIAQELEEQGYSELVSIKDDGYKTVNYSAALSLIVGKLQVKIKELEKEIENLKNKN